MLRGRILLGLVVSGAVACSGEDEPPPPNPTELAISVVDRTTGAPIPTAEILVSTLGDWRKTDDSGQLTVEVEAGIHRFRAQAAGYLSEPLPLFPLPTAVAAATQTTPVTIALEPIEGRTMGGELEGTVKEGGMPVSGVLVVAVSTTELATYTDDAGRYAFLGAPPSAYTVQAFLAGKKSSVKTSVQVTTGQTTTGVDLELTADSGQLVGGRLVGGSGKTRVHLVHPLVKEAIPGLSREADFGGPWAIDKVPAGVFEVRAALEDDGFVVDPALELEGALRITVGTSSVGLDLPIGAAIGGVQPTQSSSISGTPTLSWSAHPNADFYVVDVRRASGENVWGGFDSTKNPRFRVLPPDTAVVYAGRALVGGGRYFWRVYAAEQDPVFPANFSIIAASEAFAGDFQVNR